MQASHEQHGVTGVSGNAVDDDLLALGDELVCPRCGSTLRRDPLWSRPYFIDDKGHSYSNTRVLLAELREHGWRQ